jgi:hypothetical protein
MTTDRATVLLRAEALEFPAVTFANGSARLSGEDSWRRQMPDMLPGFLPEIARQLDAFEASQRRADDFEDRELARDARRVEAATPDPALIEAERAEDLARLERYERERPARQEALLVEIRDALQTLVKAGK